MAVDEHTIQQLEDEALAPERAAELLTALTGEVPQLRVDLGVDGTSYVAGVGGIEAAGPDANAAMIALARAAASVLRAREPA